ncbi:MAG: bifunctional oligoribonuclease/PAP phosphatase NrnA [Bacteroidetes bacterium]|nr:bifunctional oligoribonuclease/PAP phosphatase NrnA [Bacteroidota bacterium]
MENYLENSDFIQVREILDKSGKIIISTHTNPDGDAIGASLALFLYLKKRGFVVTVIIPDPYPEFLAWMPGAKEIKVFESDQERCKELIGESDLIVCVDFNNLSRLNELQTEVRNSGSGKVLIDHHLNPADEFDYKISFNKISSTSEMVYDFIGESGYRHLIDKEIAECLYTGIATDTGSFSYSCNYVKTYLITAELFRLGIDGEHIHRLIYDTYSESRLRLLGYAVSDGLIVLPEYHTAYIVLTKDDLIRFNYEVGDTEGVVNYALSIRDINLAALFMERDDQVKVSFRSKGNFSVDRLAREHFGGGGHRNASGANCFMTLTETVESFLKLLPEFRISLKNVYND